MGMILYVQLYVLNKIDLRSICYSRVYKGSDWTSNGE